MACVHFSSSVPKPISLKDRLAQIIPQEIENVRLPLEFDSTLFIVLQVKAIRAEHGKKTFGPVLVDQLYGYVRHDPHQQLFSSIGF